MQPEIPVGQPRDLLYLAAMDWQQIVALGIVGITAGVFAWQHLRPRRFDFHRETGCGCGGAGGPKPSYTVRCRKGESPQVVYKS